MPDNTTTNIAHVRTYNLWLDRLYSLADVADMLALHPATVARLRARTNAGRLVGRSWVLTAADIRTMALARRKKS